MFMSAREITDKYQPLDGDRQESWDNGSDERAGEWTQRSQRTDGKTNDRARRWKGGKEGYGSKGTDNPRFTGRNTTGGSPTYKRPESDNDSLETDDQLYARKYDEAQMSPEEYSEHHHGRELTPKYERPGGGETKREGTYRETWRGQSQTDNPRKSETYEPFEPIWGGGESVRDSVVREGVHAPLSLGRQFGSQGKPQIVGGHHRLAVMKEEKPDDLIPVLHFKSISDAQSKTLPNGQPSPWKYT